MAEAKIGDTVKVHYKGSLKDGSVFDSSFDREPLEFKLGDRSLIPGFEKAVEGMQEGDTKNVVIPPEEGYGQARKDLVAVIQKERMPSNIDPKLGMKLHVNSQDGTTFEVTVTDLNDETVTLDGNHPLAGRELDFEIKLLEIV